MPHQVEAQDLEELSAQEFLASYFPQEGYNQGCSPQDLLQNDPTRQDRLRAAVVWLGQEFPWADHVARRDAGIGRRELLYVKLGIQRRRLLRIRALDAGLEIAWEFQIPNVAMPDTVVLLWANAFQAAQIAPENFFQMVRQFAEQRDLTGNQNGRMPVTVGFIGDSDPRPGDPQSDDLEPPQHSTTSMHLNTILYGPPGTGKTFATTGLALSRFPDVCVANPLLNTYAGHCLAETYAPAPPVEEWRSWLKEFERLRREGRIEFTTFHQNYAYEDFIEGIRARTGENGVEYRTEPGVLKRIAYRALYAWLTGEPAPSGADGQPDVERKVHDFLCNGAPPRDYKEGDAPPPPYVLIIDEINRGNMARILGELITLVEESKRARQVPGLGDQPLMATLPYTNKPFILPPNLYILGTMNTADRSLVGLDVALRRRFSFVELKPRPEALGERDGVRLNDFLLRLNERIEKELDRDHLIGHAFLASVQSMDDLADAMGRKIIPQLREYFHDRPDLLKRVLARANDPDKCDFIKFADDPLREIEVNREALKKTESYRDLIGTNP